MSSDYAVGEYCEGYSISMKSYFMDWNSLARKETFDDDCTLTLEKASFNPLRILHQLRACSLV